MHNLRTDRSTTTRALDGDATIGDQDMQSITRNRGAEMPALQNALVLLPGHRFGDKATLLPALVSLNDTITKLQAESPGGFQQA